MLRDPDRIWRSAQQEMRPALVGATPKARPARRERAHARRERARARFENSFQSRLLLERRRRRWGAKRQGRAFGLGCVCARAWGAKSADVPLLWGVRTMAAPARRLRDESGPRHGGLRDPVRRRQLALLMPEHNCSETDRKIRSSLSIARSCVRCDSVSSY